VKPERETADPSALLGMTKRGRHMTGREWLLKERVLVKGQVERRRGLVIRGSSFSGGSPLL
jgi:hypothetical protein